MTDSLVAARDPLFFPDQELEPHRPDALLLFEADVPNHVEDVAGFEEQKVQALLAHRSQYETTLGIEATDETADVSRRGALGRCSPSRSTRKLAEHGAVAGFALGESFHRLGV